MPTIYEHVHIVFAKANIDECVRPGLRDKGLAEKWTSFSSEDRPTMVPFKDHMISLKQFDKRTPGNFKPEFVGNGQTCLNSKVYHIWNDTDEKTSCKGLQEKKKSFST